MKQKENDSGLNVLKNTKDTNNVNQQISEIGIIFLRSAWWRKTKKRRRSPPELFCFLIEEHHPYPIIRPKEIKKFKK